MANTRWFLLGALLLLLPAEALAQTTHFSASKEFNGPLASGIDVMSVFNPVGSGKTLYLDHLQVTMGSAYAREPGFDIWISNSAGSGCARVIQVKPLNLAAPTASVVIANAQCVPKPTADPAWNDGPLYQFAGGDHGPRLDLDGIALPPGMGITIRADWPEVRVDETGHLHLVWRE